MSITELRELCQRLEADGRGDFSAAYLCPDGYKDDVTSQHQIDEKAREVTFLSYIHRDRLHRGASAPSTNG
jgi:hypothetical protein